MFCSGYGWVFSVPITCASSVQVTWRREVFTPFRLCIVSSCSFSSFTQSAQYWFFCSDEYGGLGMLEVQQAITWKDPVKTRKESAKTLKKPVKTSTVPVNHIAIRWGRNGTVAFHDLWGLWVLILLDGRHPGKVCEHRSRSADFKDEGIVPGFFFKK